MSMVQDLMAAVIDTECKIDQQIHDLCIYKMQIDKVLERIEAALNGSRQEYGNKMVQQLISTKKEIDRTIGQLEMSKQKLNHVRNI